MITPKVTVDTSKLERAIGTMLRETDKAYPEVVRLAGVYFAQSAAVATPPVAGKRKFTRKTKLRTVTAYWDADGRKKVRKRYRVKYRTTKKKGAAWFASRPEANQFAEILYRGIGRAGWYASIAALGQSVADQPGGKGTKRNVGRWGGGSVHRGVLAPTATISNAAPNIPMPLKLKAAKIGQYKASKRLLGASRAMMKKSASKGGFRYL